MNAESPAPAKVETATVGGGCFWCVEGCYLLVPGVIKVTSGYAGGPVDNPTYEQVCGGATGHAEVVQVTFDPEKISYAKVIELFWQAHDPTQVNRQGNDVGTQYRSAMFFANDAQKLQFETARDRASEYWDGGLVTEISPLGTWFEAEGYHQDFFAKNPGQGYCMAVALPKVNKIRKSFAEYVLAS